MNKLKKIISVLTVISTSVAFTACGEKTDNSKRVKDVDPAVRKAIAENASGSELLTGELENKTIKWLAEWDIRR
ncbi:MAG: hypothetical protein K2G14_04365 [Ruminococcus sp.]|nr:hypothetical protein [Ruminococcus sp.]